MNGRVDPFSIRSPRDGKKGFTLIELLVVIAIIAVLAALVFPSAKNMIASGQSAKAAGNLRGIGSLLASYTADNNNCLPILIDYSAMGSKPEDFRFWQNLIRLKAGISSRPVADFNTDPWLPEFFYDPVVKTKKHPWGDFGGNDSIILGLYGGTNVPEKNCRVVFGNDRGTPLAAIGPLSKKVIVASAVDQPGSPWASSWYFQGDQFALKGLASNLPKPAARNGIKALCLFADGHTEALDLAKMSPAERRQYFLRDTN